QDLALTVRSEIGSLFLDQQTQFRRRGRRRRRQPPELALTDQFLEETFAIVVVAILVGEGKARGAVGLARVEMPADMALGFSAAGVIRSNRVPADPLALFRLTVPCDEEREKGFAFIDSLAHVELDLARASPPADIQGHHLAGLREGNRLVIIIEGFQGTYLVPLDKPLDDIALFKLLSNRTIVFD